MRVWKDVGGVQQLGMAQPTDSATLTKHLPPESLLVEPPLSHQRYVLPPGPSRGTRSSPCRKPDVNRFLGSTSPCRRACSVRNENEALRSVWSRDRSALPQESARSLIVSHGTRWTHASPDTRGQALGSAPVAAGPSVPGAHSTLVRSRTPPGSSGSLRAQPRRHGDVAVEQGMEVAAKQEAFLRLPPGSR